MVKRASLRRKKTDKAFLKHKEKFNNLSDFIFNLKNEEIIKKYKYWVIIKNKFPHDLITKKSDLLVPKRVFSTLFEINQDELCELNKIKKEIIDNKSYNSILEPINGSVQKYFHFHLWVLRDYDDIKDMFLSGE